MKLNKMAGALLAVAVTMSTALFGAEEMESRKSLKPNGCMGPVLCTQNPSLMENACDASWHFEIGLMYQQLGFADMNPGFAFQPAFFAQTGVPFVNVYATDITQSFNYDLGLLLSLGHYMAHDNWYAEVHFDWLNSSVSNFYNAAGTVYQPADGFDTNVLIGSGHAPGTSVFNSISSTAKMTLYTLDFNLSRGSYASKAFAFEPVLGVEVLWIDTTQDIAYEPAFGDPANIATYYERQNNWGVGPRFGLNSLYHVVQEMYFFMDSSVAVLYGEARLTSTSALNAGGTVAANQVIDWTVFKPSQYYVPVRAILGVQFSRYCLEEKHYLALKVGYDARAVISATDFLKGAVASGLYLNFEWSF